jgi:hypothetical protein
MTITRSETSAKSAWLPSLAAPRGASSDQTKTNIDPKLPPPFARGKSLWAGADHVTRYDVKAREV